MARERAWSRGRTVSPAPSARPTGARSPSAPAPRPLYLLNDHAPWIPFPLLGPARADRPRGLCGLRRGAGSGAAGRRRRGLVARLRGRRRQRAARAPARVLAVADHAGACSRGIAHCRFTRQAVPYDGYQSSRLEDPIHSQLHQSRSCQPPPRRQAPSTPTQTQTRCRGQAGVALGLTRIVGGSFPEWGASFQALMTAAICANMAIGPPAFRYSLIKVGGVGWVGWSAVDGWVGWLGWGGWAVWVGDWMSRWPGEVVVMEAPLRFGERRLIRQSITTTPGCRPLTAPLLPVAASGWRGRRAPAAAQNRRRVRAQRHRIGRSRSGSDAPPSSGAAGHGGERAAQPDLAPCDQPAK